MEDIYFSIEHCAAPDLLVLRALKQLAQRETFAELVQSIVTDRAMLTAIAARSFPHPLGFNKIVIEEFPNGAKLRLHTWLEGQPSGEDSDIHDHFWNYASVLLTGSLTITEYAPSNAGKEFYHYCLFPLVAGGHRQEFVGMDKLVVEQKADFSQGDIFVGERSRIHAVKRASDSMAATIVFQEASTAAANNIYAERPAQMGEKIIKERTFEPEQLRTMLLHTLNSI